MTHHLPDRETVLRLVRERRQDWTRRYGIAVAGLIGSVGRGTAGADSDVDLLADVSGSPSLFDLEKLQQEISDELGCKVDVVLRSGLAPHWRAFAEAELVAA
ncbi:MAG: nucleotidyltransferase family protein [Glycocaulis sp.]